MQPERTFNGIYPVFFTYFILVSVGISIFFVLVFTIVSKFFLLPLFFAPVLIIPIWVLFSNIRSVSFKKDYVVIIKSLGSQEKIAYQNLQKISLKQEGFNGKAIYYLQYSGENQKVKRVNFRTYNLDVKSFQSELRNIKKEQA